jgi:twinkle protein
MWPTDGYQRLSRIDIEQAEDWFAGRLMMVVCDAERQKPTLDWLIERGEAMVQRFGVTDYLIDPWNQVDHGRPNGMTETEFIGESLQRLASFGLRYGCNVWVNVHPAKPMPAKDSKRGGAPGPYDCHGSSHWFNRADLGITVHNPADGQAEVHRWKARFMRRWGGKTAVAALDFDPVLGRYRTPLSKDDGPMAGYWKDTD